MFSGGSMKTRFQRLDKEGKKEVRKKYSGTKKGHVLAPVLNRLIIWGILSFICAGVIIYTIISEDYSKWMNISLGIIVALLIIFGVIFFVGQYKVRQDEYNRYIAYKDSKKVKK